MAWSWTNNAFAIPGGPNYDLYPADNVVPGYSLSTFSLLAVSTFVEGATISFPMTPTPVSGTTYEVRRLDGTIVASGPANVDPLVISPLPAGWYITSVIRATPHVPSAGKTSWGNSQDGNTFCVVRANGSLPPMRAFGESRGVNSFQTNVNMHYWMLAGPERFSILDAARPTSTAVVENIASVAAEVTTANSRYLPYDTARPKKLFCNFPYYLNAAQLTVVATGGTFTLSVGGQTTSALTYNASAATVSTALAALSNVGAGKADTEGGPLATASVRIYLHETSGGVTSAGLTANGASLTGTSPSVTVNTEAAGVTAAVNALKTDIKLWEANNEPNGQGGFGAQPLNWIPHQHAFHDQVHAADAAAQTMGPSTVSITGDANSYNWLSIFFGGGGGDDCDVIAIHDYNGTNADLVLARQAWDNFVALLTTHGQHTKERWITEWGQVSTHYGILSPVRHARWVMFAYMLWEQYGIPKEHVAYFYDSGAGFWGYASQWELSNAEGPMPVIPMMRVRSEELLGKTWAARLNFGTVEDRYTIGSRFTGSDGTSVLEIASCGREDQSVTLTLSSTVGVQVVSPFGIVTSPTIVGGNVVLPIRNCIPTYLRLPSGVTATVVTPTYGSDLALGHTTIGSGTGTGRSKINDGVLRTWYLTQTGDYRTDATAPYTDDTAPVTRTVTDLVITNGSKVVTSATANFTSADVGREIAYPGGGNNGHGIVGEVTNSTTAETVFAASASGTVTATVSNGLPAWVGIDFGSSTTFNRVVIHCPTPWQGSGTLLDYDLDYWNGSAWVTIQTVTEAAKTVQHVRSEVVGNSQADSYFSDRSIFDHSFASVSASKVRIYVRDATYGGSPDKTATLLGGEHAPQRVTLRAFEVYNSSGVITPPPDVAVYESWGAVLI